MSLENVSKHIKNKGDFWRACVSNGKFMPSLKCGICTTDMLREVRTGECHMPLLSTIKFKAVAYPPANSIVQKRIIEVIEQGDFKEDLNNKARYFRLKFYLE